MESPGVDGGRTDAHNAMGGFILGGIVLVFGLMAFIGGVAQANQGVGTVGAVLSLIGAALCGASILTRERNPAVRASRALAWTRLLRQMWPAVFVDLERPKSLPTTRAAIHGTSVLRPHLGAYVTARWASMRRPQFVLFFLYLVVVGSPWRHWQWGLLGLALAVSAVSTEFARARIELDPVEITVQQVFRRRSFPLSEVAGVVFASPSFLGQTRRQAILVGSNGQKLYSFPVEVWDEAELRGALADGGITSYGRWEVVPWSVAG